MTLAALGLAFILLVTVGLPISFAVGVAQAANFAAPGSFKHTFSWSPVPYE